MSWEKRLIKYSLVITGGAAIFGGYKWRLLPAKVPLFYSLPWGKDQLADKWWLAGVLASVAAVGLLNKVISDKVVGNNKYLRMVLAGFTLIYTILAVITLIKIILLIS